ncbi:hypothetical protein OE88DRAFT_321943 [Heliocybe sulcata]|uniref:Uncharacterized protein n=1 Tax=Heliocybe sulcata TaxID=5364 RepID=A0A5C3MY59_9AGAM|nr:hypothetical protein OE88DRAFT_321943 [Heliocybe sulcata]
MPKANASFGRGQSSLAVTDVFSQVVNGYSETIGFQRSTAVGPEKADPDRPAGTQGNARKLEDPIPEAASPEALQMIKKSRILSSTPWSSANRTVSTGIRSSAQAWHPHDTAKN